MSHERSDPRLRVLLLAVRQALLILLGAIEEYLGLRRSRPARRNRKREKPHEFTDELGKRG